MDSMTYNFGPLVVPAANFANPLDGPSDVNIRTAWQGYGHDGPSKASNSIFDGWFLKKNALSGYKMHFLKVTCVFPINTRVKNWFLPLFPFKTYVLFQHCLDFYWLPRRPRLPFHSVKSEACHPQSCCTNVTLKSRAPISLRKMSQLPELLPTKGQQCAA